MSRSKKQSGRDSLAPKGARDHALKRYVKSELFWLLVVCLGAVAVFALTRSIPASDETAITGDSILFVGDVMLARNVERLMNEHGSYYPYKGVRDMLAEHEQVIGNFEASIPELHRPTPSFTFRFSVSPDILAALPRVGFTAMTLANNHSYDYGEGGYLHTRDTLIREGLATGGNPMKISADEVLYRRIADTDIAIIPIHATTVTPVVADIREVLALTAEKSDLQVVFIHWGTEYESVSDSAQQTFAHAVIDAGADAIIGHHPHVVQNIEEYRGTPIFYSLGNFIFDQYWNTEVREGLTVAISFEEDRVHYTLIPVSSMETKSQPRPMNRIERTQFLDVLAAKSEDVIADAIRNGSIVEPFARRKSETLID
ncbi:CapA family protein [Candidatus Kaiserbacteria bacterium]|nr:CapA family protein [Candidatus Kaiserbacteria bacterium]